jgi:uncharacterized repeat protein (TIGR02543 family)
MNGLVAYFRFTAINEGENDFTGFKIVEKSKDVKTGVSDTASKLFNVTGVTKTLKNTFTLSANTVEVSGTDVSTVTVSGLTSSNDAALALTDATWAVYAATDTNFTTPLEGWSVNTTSGALTVPGKAAEASYKIVATGTGSVAGQAVMEFSVTRADAALASYTIKNGTDVVVAADAASGSLAVPGGTGNVTLTVGDGKDQYGEDFTISALTVNTTPTGDAMTVTYSSGNTFTVANATKTGTISVTAGSIEKTITVTHAGAYVNALTVTGKGGDSSKFSESTVTINGEENGVTLTTTATDNFSDPTTGYTLSIANAQTGVSATVDGKDVKVTGNSKEGTFDIVATDSADSSKKVTKTITVARSSAVADATTMAIGANPTGAVEIPVTLPTTGPDKTVTLTLTGKDQFGDNLVLSGAGKKEVTWTLKKGDSSYSGADVTLTNNEDGTATLTVKAAAKDNIASTQDFTITATVDMDKSKETTVTVKRAASTVATVTVTSTDVSATIPLSGSQNTEGALAATVTDQYGADITTSATITWSVSDTNNTGASLSGSTIVVPSTATENGTFKVKAHATTAADATGKDSSNEATVTLVSLVFPTITVTTKASPVYGDDWDTIVESVKIGDGTAADITGSGIECSPTLAGNAVVGKLFLKDPTDKPAAGEGRSFTIYFKADDGNSPYQNVTAKTGTVTVAKKEVTVTAGDIAVTKVYDGETSSTGATITGALACTGTVEGESLTVTQNGGTYADASAGSGLTFTFTGSGLALASTETGNKDNYTIVSSQTTGGFAISAASITALPVTLSWSTDNALEYTGEARTYAGATISNLKARDADKVTLTYDATNKVTQTNVGEYTATVTGLGGDNKDNYTITGVDSSTLSHAWSITAMEVTVTWSVDGETVTGTSKSVGYNPSGHIVSYTVASKKDSTAVDGSHFQLASGSAAASVTNVSSTPYSYTVEGKDATDKANFTPVNNGTFALTITPATLTLTGTGSEAGSVTVTGVSAKTYDNTKTVGGSLTFKVKGNGSDVLNAELPTGGKVEWKTVNAGETKLIISGLAISSGDPNKDNYTLKGSNIEVAAGEAIAQADRAWDATTTTGTITLTPNTPSATLVAKVADDKDLDSSARYTFEATAGEDKVNLDGAKVTGVKDGSATIAMKIPETTNYNELTRAVTVSVVLQPVKTVAIAGDTGDNITAKLDGDKIIIAGTLAAADENLATELTDSSDAHKLKVTLADGLTSYTKEIDNGKLVIKDGSGNEVVSYTIVKNVEVVGTPEKTTLALDAPKADTENSGAGSNVNDAISTAVANVAKDSDNKISGVNEAAGATIAQRATEEYNKLTNEQVSTLRTGMSDSADVVLESQVSMKVTAESAKTLGGADATDVGDVAQLELDIKPTLDVYARQAKGSTTNEIKLIEGEEIKSFAAPVEVTVDLNGMTQFTAVGAKVFAMVGSAKASVTMSGTKATFALASPGKVTLVVDSRHGTVNFVDENNDPLGSAAYDYSNLGESFSVANPTKSGYTFTGWEDNSGTKYSSVNDALLTKLGNGTTVTLTAKFTQNSTPTPPTPPTTPTIGGGGFGGGGYTPSSRDNDTTTYSIGNTTPRSEHGTVKFANSKVAAGKTATITVTPDAGYELGELTVTDAKGNAIRVTRNADGTYSFTMPDSSVKVNATFVPEGSQVTAPNFIDVPAYEFYADPVAWAVKNGITNGTSPVTFSPNDPCTRGQVVTFLYRAAGSPEVEPISAFVDVPANEYYAKAVAWAVANGITNGKDGLDTFKPDDACTRAEIVTFLARFEKASLIDANTRFEDVPATEWYAGAVAWAINSGITTGTSATTFSPNDVCTRGQVVTFLYRDFATK